MKRFFALLLIPVTLLALTGCNRISIRDDGNAVLRYSDIGFGDTGEFSQTLTEEETRMVKEYLTSAAYFSGIAGCPFDERVSIVFGDQIFAIAGDDCPTIWMAGTDKYYTISEEGRKYIVSLFEKYVGSSPRV